MFSQLDSSVLHVVNGFAGTNETLDFLVRFITTSDLVKGIPVMLMWWGLWFYRSDDHQRVRAGLVGVLLCAVGAIVAGRALAVVLPFTLRPAHDPTVDAVLPIGASESTLTGMSSMPSDHAVLFFALAISMLLINRTIGYVLLVHAVIVIGLPRVFMAYHYPSDVLVGGLVGTLIAVLLWRPITAAVERSGLLTLERHSGHLFYPGLFLVSYQAHHVQLGPRFRVCPMARRSIARGVRTHRHAVSL